MGQVESAAPPEEIIGKNDTQPLSEADVPLTADEKKEYDTEVDRLLCSDTVHTAMDLDDMWTLYATGDIRFSNRIKNVIDDPT